MAHMRVNLDHLKMYATLGYQAKRPGTGYGQRPRTPCKGPPDTRKHFHQANVSTVFDEQRKDCSRMSGMIENSIGSHAEKRHFPTKSNLSQQQNSN